MADFTSMSTVCGTSYPFANRDRVSVAMVGNFLRRLGRWAYEHDVRLFHVRVTERILGPKHPDTLASMNNLALVLSNQGKYEQAEEMHRRKLELSETVVGKKHEQPRHSAEISGEVSRSGADVSERTGSEREGTRQGTSSHTGEHAQPRFGAEGSGEVSRGGADVSESSRSKGEGAGQGACSLSLGDMGLR